MEAMADTRIDKQAAMVGILQAVADLQAQDPETNLTEELPGAVPDLSPEDYRELVVMLKLSRCLDATLRDGPEGKQIDSIDGITTRGLRELQKAWSPPATQHSCPADGDDGRLGFFGQ